MSQVQSQHQPIAHQNVGCSFSGTYYVENVFIKQTKANKDYSDFTLRDKSGSRFVKYWGVVSNVKKGDFVFISANVEDYMGSPSIIAKNVELSDPPADLSDYIAVYEGVDEYANRFDNIREELKRLEGKTSDSTIGKLVDEVYGNSAFFQKFVVSPGSARPHYGRQGGLLASTVRAAEQCMRTAESYLLEDRERAILIASALLFRIGAIDAFEFKDFIPVETKRGILLGLNNLTMTRVASAHKRVLSGFSKEGKTPDSEAIVRIFHAISAYTGVELKPMTKEALILSAAYRTDSDMVDVIEFIQNDVNVAEEFTAYDPAMRRKYYRGIVTNATT